VEAIHMIVIGVDVHKQAVTAVAVDEAGRLLDEKTILVGGDELLEWAAGFEGEVLWALEDCRRLTRWLEQQLLTAAPKERTAAEERSSGHWVELRPRRATCRRCRRLPGLADATRESREAGLNDSKGSHLHGHGGKE